MGTFLEHCPLVRRDILVTFGGGRGEAPIGLLVSRTSPPAQLYRCARFLLAGQDRCLNLYNILYILKNTRAKFSNLKCRKGIRGNIKR